MIAVGVAFLLAALTFRRMPAHAILLAATGLLWFAGTSSVCWCSPTEAPHPLPAVVSGHPADHG